MGDERKSLQICDISETITSLKLGEYLREIILLEVLKKDDLYIEDTELLYTFACLRKFYSHENFETTTKEG